MSPAAMDIERAPFGTTAAGEPVERFTLHNGALQVGVLTFGGILHTIEVPDRHGRTANVTLGFADLAGYERRGPYFGCITGRYANRIAGGRFRLGGVEYRLPVNAPPNSLHGGDVGLDRKVWAASTVHTADTVGVRLRHTSPDGDQGYPGTLACTVTYTLTPDGAIRLDYEATTDRETVVNLTSHAYFNLAGEGAPDCYDHELWLGASRYTPVDPTLIPTGRIEPVAGTPMDFTVPTAIGARLGDGFPQLTIGQGYDHNYVVDGESGRLSLAARVTEPGSGRVLTVHTTEPGIQFYAGNLLDGTLVGTGGRPYHRGAGFALETQHFPDSPNRPEFPSTVLRPGEVYRTSTEYRFSTA